MVSCAHSAGLALILLSAAHSTDQRNSLPLQKFMTAWSTIAIKNAIEFTTELHFREHKPKSDNAWLQAQSDLVTTISRALEKSNGDFCSGFGKAGGGGGDVGSTGGGKGGKPARKLTDDSTADTSRKGTPRDSGTGSGKASGKKACKNFSCKLCSGQHRAVDCSLLPTFKFWHKRTGLEFCPFYIIGQCDRGNMCDRSHALNFSDVDDATLWEDGKYISQRKRELRDLGVAKAAQVGERRKRTEPDEASDEPPPKKVAKETDASSSTRTTVEDVQRAMQDSMLNILLGASSRLKDCKRA